MGHHNINFHGDPPAGPGQWGVPTSRANFCEQDYAITRYLAEFINSVSNIAYIYLAIRAMYPRTRSSSSSLLRPNVDFMSVALLILGIGSFLFHATLRQAFEFVDELSMLILNWAMLQAVLVVRQTPQRAKFYSVGLAVLYLSFSAFYIYSAKTIYQVIAFLTGIAAITARGQYLFYAANPPLPRSRSSSWNRRGWEAIGISALGYLIWNIDLEFCKELRQLKALVGLPLSWGLELHGWWHVLTAIGADRFMTVAREMREWEKEEREQEKTLKST